MSRKIDHKIWENPPHLFGRQAGSKLGRLSRGRRRKRSSLKFKGEDILANVSPKKNKDMSLFDLQTVAFWTLKNATKIAAIETFTRGLPGSVNGCNGRF